MQILNADNMHYCPCFVLIVAFVCLGFLSQNKPDARALQMISCFENVFVWGFVLGRDVFDCFVFFFFLFFQSKNQQC